MGFVSSLFGGQGGSQGGAGLNYSASGVGLMQPTDTGQVGNAYSQANSGVNQQQAFLNAIQGYTPQALAGQQTAANMYAQEAAGQGPNPAMAQFQQNQNQIQQQNAAQLASARGINPALAAQLNSRSAGQAGQQNAANEAGLQAQQQLAGQQGLANLSTQQVGQAQGALQGYNQAAQSEQQNLLNSLQGFNTNNVNMQSNINSANAGVSQVAAGQQGQIAGGIIGGAGRAIGFAAGGPVSSLFASAPSNQSNNQLPSSGFAQALDAQNKGSALYQGASDFGQSIGGLFKSNPSNEEMDQTAGAGWAENYAKGGKIPLKGERYAMQMKPVPGKANVNGDSLKNDTVKAKLSPGEIIIPRSIATHANAPAMAAKFVAAIKARQGLR